MGWFSARRSREQRIALLAPALDGSTWPPDQPGARTGFGAATTHRMGLDAAFSPRAQDIADLVTARLVSLLDFDAAPEDVPHVIDVLRSAARVGAGIGIVDGRNGSLTLQYMGRDAVGALGEAERDLPRLAPPLHAHARFVMHAGHHLARVGPQAIDDLEQAIVTDRSE